MILPLVTAAVLAVSLQQDAGGRGTPVEYSGAAGELDVITPQLLGAQVDVDGNLDEEVWSRAALLNGFTQYDPVEGAPASERTEVLVFVSDDAIYFGIRAYDRSPEEIRATVAERDEFTRSDDYVRVVLDTFDDQRRGYVFTVNPYGIQHDGLWVEGGRGGMPGGAGFRGGGGGGGFGGFGGSRFAPIDDNPDFIWRSAGQQTDFGWVAELAIPFKSMRFPQVDVQSWGINVFRRIQRSGYQQSWAPISGDVANQLTLAGHLTGLRDIDAGLFLEINPVITGTRLGKYDGDLDRFDHDDPDGEFGLNVTYGLTSNLTLDGTYNPDFSQVEADAGQIAVNERFALFFPEKRPFFLEGTEIFQLPANLIFTRTISNPTAGAKIAGKVGSLNLGYLGAIDDLGADTENALVNLLRVRQDLGASSTVGAVYTDRTINSQDFNRVGGADARLVLANRYTLTLLGAASWTDRGEDLDTETGMYLSAAFNRTGRELSWSASVQDHAPGFTASSGFLPRAGETQVNLSTSFTRFGSPGSLLERWGPVVNVQGYWDHDTFWDGGGFEEGRVSLSSSLSFRNRISLALSASLGRYDFPVERYAGLYVLGPSGATTPFRPDQDRFGALSNFNVFAFISTWERLRGNIQLSRSETPIFDRTFGVPVAVGDSWRGSVSLDLFPTPSLQGEVRVTHSRIDRRSDGARYSSATIPRVRLQYQFSPSLFVRTIAEYSAQSTEDLIDPVTGLPLVTCDAGGCDPRVGSDANDVHVEGLISYEPSPGTVFFIGYTREFEDSGAFDFQDVRSRADGLFVKLSYRFRM